MNDQLTEHAMAAGVWGLPSQPDTTTPAELPPGGYDYSAGLLVGLPDTEAVAVAELHPHLLRAYTDAPAFQTPHEATHRRYEPPFTVPIDQAAIGYTKIADAKGLHYVKLLGGVVLLTAAGTIQFVQGAGVATDPPMTGAMPYGASSGWVSTIVKSDTPWHFTAPDQTFGLVTTGAGALAKGWLVCCYSPYDS